MKAINNKRIAIVGGGPGGLTLARLLQQKGADVKVYERDASRNVRVQGATLDLHEESGLAALREGGLMDEFRKKYRPGADKLCITDKHATVHFCETEGATEEAGAYFRPEIDRGPLRDLLLDSLQDGTVVWNSHFASMQKKDNVWQLSFQDGSTATADLVIAADGANSKIRPLITPVKAFYSGVTMVEGAVYDAEQNAPRISKLLNGGKIFAMGDSKTLIVSSKGDGSLVFYTGCKVAEDWVRSSGVDFNSREQVKNWFCNEFAGWDEVWLELFDNAKAPFIPRPQYCMPFDQQWPALPDLTMLGDAAHLMPPFAGEGVNMAMQDALELSRCLTDERNETPQQAIEAYERQMLARASDAAQMTMQQTEVMHSPESLQKLLEMFRQ